MPASTERLREIVARYPQAIRDGQRDEIARFAFQVELLRERVPPGATVCDIGGGWGTFALGCAAAGLRPILIDDFRDPGFFDSATFEAMQSLWQEYGVEVVRRDVVAEGLGMAAGSLDAVTTTDSLEHWHHSPKRLLHEVVTALKPGRLLLIGTPNCANLRKRVSLLIGRGKWTRMEDWYETEEFRGHVREPDVDDLRYIARDLRLERVEIIGRNFLGYSQVRPGWIRAATPLFDRALQFFPTLCANIYMLGYTAADVASARGDATRSRNSAIIPPQPSKTG